MPVESEHKLTLDNIRNAPNFPVEDKPRSTIIISSADSRYFILLKGLIKSIRDVNTKIAIGVLDGGLENYEIKWLREHDVMVKTVASFSLEAIITEKLAHHYIAFLERPFLPNHFPGYDNYIWADADLWIQDYGALELYIEAANKGYVGCVPELDRCYAYNEEHLKITKGWSFGNYEKFFGTRAAEIFAGKYPMINNGLFSAPADSLLWHNWQSSIFYALYNNKHADFGIDQISFNYALYAYKNLVFCPLPSRCNWLLTHANPVIKNNLLCEPLAPYEPLGILHMLDYTKWQRMGIQKIDEFGNKVASGDSRILDYNTFKEGIIDSGINSRYKV